MTQFSAINDAIAAHKGLNFDFDFGDLSYYVDSCPSNLPYILACIGFLFISYHDFLVYNWILVSIPFMWIIDHLRVLVDTL